MRLTASTIYSYRTKVFVALFAVTGLLTPAATFAEPVEGFTEPYKAINVAVPETGIVTELKVTEGDRVEEGDVIASLDSDVHQALLSIARAGMESHGRIDSAQAEVVMRKDRLEKLETLHERGHARAEEVARARADVAIAQGSLLAAAEQLQLKKLEYEKILVQLNRRTIRSPLTGTINQVFKEEGEFVAPGDPTIVSIVQLHPLTATFLMSRKQADMLKEEQSVTVTFVDKESSAEGKVEFISPTIDAESGTVRVSVRIDNADGKLQSGERCLMEL